VSQPVGGLAIALSAESRKEDGQLPVRTGKCRVTLGLELGQPYRRFYCGRDCGKLIRCQQLTFLARATN